MKKFDGGTTVPGGFYLSLEGWEVVVVQGREGVLAGNADWKYIKLNLVTLALAAVALAFSFAFFLPGVGFVLFAMALFRPVGRLLGRMFGKGAAAAAD